MINAQHHRVPNVTLNYAIGFPFFGQNSMEASLEESEVIFHLPEQTLVYIKPESWAQPHHDNPNYFRHITISQTLILKEGVPRRFLE